MKPIITIIVLALLISSCVDQKHNTEHNEALTALQVELDSLKQANADLKTGAKEQITTFLTFQDDNAEEAMNFYVSLFENSKVIHIQRHGSDGPGKEGSILHATFELNGSQFACSDSPPIHDWDFTPAVSNFVDCKSDEDIETLFAKLSENGQVMMPLGNYGWSQKFAFVEDRFGVSWQLNLQ
ncbi:VOC family protein [Winogradskyella sp. 3972H.M.0a.05]|uniref:VOC family protein n=1 Tax=Winogradskyella sp. 3972H.M.0a.05 TaxID=2950277 RepID=UPI003390EFF8